MGVQPTAAPTVPPTARQDTAASPKVRPSAEAARRARRQGDERPEAYVVQQGDTLYGIALDFGFDYRDLGAWNGLQDPSRIYVGQRLRLVAPSAPDQPVVRARPDSAGDKPVPLDPAEPASVRATPGPVPRLAEPKALTLPYSEEAVSRLRPPPPRASATSAQGEGSSGGGAVASPAVPSQVSPSAGAATSGDEAPAWIWPARGDLLYRFGESGRLKGIGIGGKLGDPVMASAPGKVVYSGSGLRGYGQLVIVKHNETYFSVYAHNSALLVREGDLVKRGQTIAQMGESDAARVGLHFELRRFGRPVDPLAFLPTL